MKKIMSAKSTSAPRSITRSTKHFGPSPAPTTKAVERYKLAKTATGRRIPKIG